LFKVENNNIKQLSLINSYKLYKSFFFFQILIGGQRSLCWKFPRTKV